MRILSTLLPVLLVVVALPTPTLGEDFDDGDYHESILFDWDTAHMDVLVLPAAAPDPALRLLAINQSIDAWATGIDALGEQWLVDGFSLDRYTLPYDTPTESALSDPEVIVVSAEYNPVVLFGIGVSWDYLVCDSVESFLTYLLEDVPDWLGITAAEPELPPAFHQHEGSPWAVATTDCDDATQNVCLVLNTNFAVNEHGQYHMYNLNAHEFGHCLGIGHVGDAFDFEAKTFPEADIMSYQFDENHVFCVSNLNVKSIEGTYAKVLGQPESEWLDYGDYVHMKPSQYTQVNCPNPPT